MGKEPNDPQPEPSSLQTPVVVEDGEMTVDNPLSFLYIHFRTNRKPASYPPSIQQA
jgi:hypothetical protein